MSLSEGEDEWHMPTFAFHDLNYIPSGYSGILAPYIESGAGTWRAAVDLMQLERRDSDLAGLAGKPTRQVVCDLGSGDGSFLIGLLAHVNLANLSTVHGVGVDYDPELVKVGKADALAAGETVAWMVYDFNEDRDDIVAQLGLHGVTHVFCYLVPKQLALPTVRRILTRLWEGGVCICCHKFQPTYLTPTRTDELLNLVVYERPREKVSV